MSHDLILNANAIAEMAGMNKTHFLNENAQRLNKSLGDAVGLTGFGFHIIEVAPERETTEFHMHYHEDECVFVLAGTATATIGADDYAIGPGDFIGYPKGGPPHTIRNTGQETLRLIVVGERRAHDVGDYPRQGKRIWRQEGLPANVVDLEAIETPVVGTGTTPSTQKKAPR